MGVARVFVFPLYPAWTSGDDDGLAVLARLSSHNDGHMGQA